MIFIQSVRVFSFYSAAALLAMQSAVLATGIPSVCHIQTNKDRVTRSAL